MNTTGWNEYYWLIEPIQFLIEWELHIKKKRGNLAGSIVLGDFSILL